MHNQYRAWRMLSYFFGHASEKKSAKSATTMAASYDEVESAVVPFCVVDNRGRGRSPDSIKCQMQAGGCVGFDELFAHLFNVRFQVARNSW